MITIGCACGRRYQTQDANAGKRTRCPACGQLITVPALDLEAVVVASPGTRSDASVLVVSQGAGRIRERGGHGRTKSRGAAAAGQGPASRRCRSPACDPFVSQTEKAGPPGGDHGERRPGRRHSGLGRVSALRRASRPHRPRASPFPACRQRNPARRAALHPRRLP